MEVGLNGPSFPMAKANSRGMYPNGRGKNREQFVRALHAIFDHPDYLALTFTQRALLWDISRQYDGHNNGDLSLAPKIMNKWGWKKDTLLRHRDALVANGWLVITGSKKVRKGTCYLYALSWLSIDDCGGKLFPDAYQHKPRSLRLSGGNLRLLNSVKAA